MFPQPLPAATGRCVISLRAAHPASAKQSAAATMDFGNAAIVPPLFPGAKHRHAGVLVASYCVAEAVTRAAIGKGRRISKRVRRRAIGKRCRVAEAMGRSAIRECRGVPEGVRAHAVRERSGIAEGVSRQTVAAIRRAAEGVASLRLRRTRAQHQRYR